MPKKEKKEGGCKCGCGHGHHRVGGCLYGMGFIGAAVYFIKGAATFGAGAMGLLKSLVWPALLVYEALKLLKI